MKFSLDFGEILPDFGEKVAGLREIVRHFGEVLPDFEILRDFAGFWRSFEDLSPFLSRRPYRTVTRKQVEQRRRSNGMR